MKKAGKQLKTGASAPPQNYFLTPTELIDRAYTAARNVEVTRYFHAKVDKLKAVNAMKVRAFGDHLQKNMHELSKQFPDIDNMNPFYRDLLGALTDIDELKQNLAALNGSSTVIKKIRSGYGRRIYSVETAVQANRILKEFEGRATSVVNKLDGPLKVLKIASKKLKEVPEIDFGMQTVVLSGYPNVGKTTLLRRLTGSKAKVGHYQFTTKQINIGHFEHKYMKIQVIDTPGLLDREELNNIEKKAVIALKHLAHVIVFIVDPTSGCGFTLGEQLKLLEHVKKRFGGKKLIVVVNKTDAATKEELEAVKSAIKEPVFDGEKEKGKKLLEALQKEL